MLHRRSEFPCSNVSIPHPLPPGSNYSSPFDRSGLALGTAISSSQAAVIFARIHIAVSTTTIPTTSIHVSFDRHSALVECYVMDSHIQQTSSLVTPSIESRSLLQDGLERTDLTTPSADCSIRPGAGAGWWTPQQSPHSRRIYEDSSTDPHPNWALPTPPRSDSGFTSVSFEAKENYLNQSAGSSPDLTLSLSTNATEMR